MGKGAGHDRAEGANLVPPNELAGKFEGNGALSRSRPLGLSLPCRRLRFWLGLMPSLTHGQLAHGQLVLRETRSLLTAAVRPLRLTAYCVST